MPRTQQTPATFEDRFGMRAVRYRKSYAARTGMGTRASILLAKSLTDKPATAEDADGNTVRVWKSSEMSSFTNAHLVTALSNRVAIEPGEVLWVIPPSAIKYCVTKGYLIPNDNRTLYRVTAKAALELVLPRTFKGGALHGRRIPFAV